MHKQLKKHLIFWSLFLLFSLGILTSWHLESNLADQIRLMEGDLHYINLKLPFLYVRGDRDDIVLLNGGPITTQSCKMPAPFQVEALKLGEVNLELTLFGLIPLRQFTINVLPETYLVPGGHSIGIRLHSQGVSVVGYYYFLHQGRNRSPAREAGIRVGDTIIAIQGQTVSDINQAAQLLEEAAPAGEISLVILREGKESTIILKPLYSEADGGYRIGLYIRDSAAGVGTMSFYDPETRCYGALGHIIMDTDTNMPINIDNGSIVMARIVGIRAAQRGAPGEKTGIFLEHEGFKGNIEKNTPFGIFGQLYSFSHAQSPYREAIPMALASQVTTGPAEMLTVVEGETIGRYRVEIERIAAQTRPSDKGIIIRVVDEELLAKTGGIIQGMSGSPLIQNGKLIGAVTHVFVNDPTRGYGIFMEWMYQQIREQGDTEISTN